MKHRSGIEQHQQWCVHYKVDPAKWRDGTDACKAGVVYDELTRNKELGQTGCMLRRPCIRDHHTESERRGEPLCECPHLKWPTLEESEEHEREVQKHMEKMMTALVTIDPIRKAHKGKDWSGVIECQCCKGKLHVRHAGYNGHVWAKCETDNCVAWIE